MKSKQFLSGLLIAGGLFIGNAQIQNTALTSFGTSAGTTGGNCVYFGYNAGGISTGAANSFVGQQAGQANTTGAYNAYFGQYSGSAATGNYNTFIGCGSGQFVTTGSENVSLGYHAGTTSNFAGASSTNNTCIGFNAGYNNNGNNNVFLGHGVGQGIAGSDILMIDNSNTATPLIWGSFAYDQIKLNGKVGVGGVTTFPTVAGGVNLSTYKLFVAGGILANEVRVTTTWADYVFENNYALPALSDVECFIADNGHLPNVPSAKQVEAEGISVGEIAKVQQEKIEELTLYLIGQDKLLKSQQDMLAAQGQQLKQQQNDIEELKSQMKAVIAKQ